MNFTTVIEFLEKKGYQTEYQETFEVDGEIGYLNLTLKKEGIAEINIDTTGPTIKSISIEPKVNMFCWDEGEGNLDTEEDTAKINLEREQLYLLEYVLDLIENHDLWAEHLKKYDKMVKLFREQVQEYKKIFLDHGYQFQTMNYASNFDIFIRTAEFFNRPYSLSYFCLKLDSLFLKITLECSSDLGESIFDVPFDDYYAKERIRHIVATDDLWKPIMIENQKKIKAGEL